MKNKNIFIILLIIPIVVYTIWVNRQNHKEIIPEENIIPVSTSKNTSKNIIFNLSDYPDKIIETKKELINGEEQYVVNGWIDTKNIDTEIGSIKLDLFPYSHQVDCLAINMNIPWNKVYIIKDNEEKLITKKDTSNWQNNQWINYKVYVKVEKKSTIERVFEWLITKEAQASCRTSENLKDIRKIVFQMPEAKEKQIIEAEAIYSNNKYQSNMYTLVVPKENQNLSLLMKNDQNNNYDRLPEQPFFRSISLKNSKSFVRLANNELLEVKNIAASIPFSVFKDYTLKGRFYCSKFNEYCVFGIEELIANTILAREGENITTSFEHTFLKVDNYISDDKITLYIDEAELDYLNMKPKSITINIKDILNNSKYSTNIKVENGHKHIKGDLYIKGTIICKINTEKTDLNCIVESDIIEIK